MSTHLNWLIIRNNNAFLLKKRNISKPFSSEPMNLKNLSSFRYSGIVQKRAVGIEAPKDNKGFVLVTKKTGMYKKPKKCLIKRHMKAGPRRSLYKLRRSLQCSNYRRDLTKAALRRASAILRSQKARPAKKRKPKKTE